MPPLAHMILHTVMKCCTERKKKQNDIFVGKNIPKLQIMWNNAEKVKLHKNKQKTNKQKPPQNKTRHACYSPLIEQLTTYT